MATSRPSADAPIPVIAVIGPTASGKSVLAIGIAQAVGGEIVSADSRQVYRGLDLGTGKVTASEMEGIPHHLLDVASPMRRISAEQWRRLAIRAIRAIRRRGRVPIVCGGTGFYVDALLRNVAFAPVAPDQKLRKTLSKKSAEELYALLKRLDPARAKEIDRHNPRRLVRAIEIAKAAKKRPLHPLEAPSYRTLWIGISPSDARLKRNIRKRLSERMRRGMLQEAKDLIEGGMNSERLKTLGIEYKYLGAHLGGEIKKDAALERIATASWQYAKRQRTWWKKRPDIHWLPSPDRKKAVALSKRFLGEK